LYINIEMELCAICKEKCIIPVEILCFNCYKKNEINCFSFLRVCLSCSIHYLELDKSKYERPYSKKCLYCSESALLHFITIKYAIKIDFSLMSLDTNQNYECPFCNEATGNQVEIYKHAIDQCPNFYIECICEKIIRRCELVAHRSSCVEFALCEECDQYIAKYALKDHLKHNHNLDTCYRCKMKIECDQMEDHVHQTCEYRSVLCEYCLKFCDYKSWKDHLNSHMNNLMDDISKLNNEYSSLLKRHELLNNLFERY